MLREVARLKNLRPALGPQGKVHKVAKKMGKAKEREKAYDYHAYLTENQDMYFPFPCGKFDPRRLKERGRMC